MTPAVLEHEPPMDILEVDNSAGRDAQIQRLKELRASRDQTAVQRALEALTAAARDGSGNLLERAVTAAQTRATLGEISDAMEKSLDATRRSFVRSPACTDPNLAPAPRWMRSGR